jgi:hypothetical protein
MTKASASPKVDGTIRLRDGRQLAFCEWGDLQGRPVVLLHGMPGSRLLCPDEDATDICRRAPSVGTTAFWLASLQ